MMKKNKVRIWSAAACAVCVLGMNVFAEDVEAVSEEEFMTEFAETDIQTETEALGDKPEYRALDYVTLGDYNGLSVTVENYAVTDEMVDEAVQDAIETGVDDFDLYEVDKESAVEYGDNVNVDYEGTVNGEELDGFSTEGEGEDIQVGSGYFLEDFEDQLVGAKPGDELEITVTFPEDYGLDELDGQEAVFDVTINYIKKMPEVTDDLISKITEGEVTTVDGYREYQRSLLEEYNNEDLETQINDEIMTQLYNICDISEYPQDLIDYSVKSVKNYYIEMAASFGMTFEDLMMYFGEGSENFEETVHDDVINDLQQEMILNAICEQEELALTDEEYKEGVEKYAQEYGLESAEEFESYYDHETIAQSLQMTKVLDFIRESAVVEIVEPEEETDLYEYYDDELLEMLSEDEDMSEADYIDLDEEESDISTDEEE